MSVIDKIHMFQYYNLITMKGEIVIYGSTFMANFPFYELIHNQLFSNAIYNRSIEGMTLADAELGLQSCVIEIRPKKLFLSLGEHDLDNPCALEIYDRILQRIQDRCPGCQVFLLPVANNTPPAQTFNKNLRKLANTYAARYLDIRYKNNTDDPRRIFRQMTPFLRTGEISITDIMDIH